MLSPVIDVYATRSDNELKLSEDKKSDFKVNAKQLVKIYAQLASIIPFENIAWEKLHWFLIIRIPWVSRNGWQAWNY